MSDYESDPLADAYTNGTTRHLIAGAPVYRAFSDVKLERIEWLWTNRIPAGKLTMLAGNPGEGKSFFTCDVAARLSTGAPWPDEDTTDRAPCATIILNAEDRAEDTIGPRLKAAGADLKHVYNLDAVTTVDKGVPGERLFNIDEDIAALTHMVLKIGNVRLVIVDPITAYMGKADGNSNTEVRSVLARLTAFAAANNVAVLIVTHMNKRSDASASYRTLGSIGFTAAVRAQHFLLRDKGDAGRRLLIPSKASLGVEASGLAFSIRSIPGLPETAKIEWEDAEINMSVDEAMAPGEAGRPPEERKAAEQFLRDILANGAKASVDVDDAAKAHGLSRSTVKRARMALGVKCFKAAFGGGWMMRLPADAPEPEHHEDHGIPV